MSPSFLYYQQPDVSPLLSYKQPKCVDVNKTFSTKEKKESPEIIL